jgi:hypothetical protein
MTVKTDPGDEEKIKVIQQTVGKHINLDVILGKIGSPKPSPTSKR